MPNEARQPAADQQVVRMQSTASIVIAVIGAFGSVVVAWIGARSAAAPAARAALENERPALHTLQSAVDDAQAAIAGARRFAEPVPGQLNRETTAPADGIVTAWVTAYRVQQELTIYGRAGKPTEKPYTRVLAHIRVDGNGGTESASISFPVLRGEKWMVEVKVPEGQDMELKDDAIYFFPMVQ